MGAPGQAERSRGRGGRREKRSAAAMGKNGGGERGGRAQPRRGRRNRGWRGRAEGKGGAAGRWPQGGAAAGTKGLVSPVWGRRGLKKAGQGFIGVRPAPTRPAAGYLLINGAASAARGSCPRPRRPREGKGGGGGGGW